MSKVYKLRYPITWDGVAITEIELKRPKLKHMRSISDSPTVDDLIKIASKCSDYVPPMFDELDAVDGLAICEEIGNFLSKTPETGKS